MADRTVTDTAGRTWTCVSAPRDAAATAGSELGKDVMLSCATPSVSAPLNLMVGWQWEGMASNGLARLILKASPMPRKN